MQSVLVPAPYYAAFEFDVGARAGLSVVAVDTAGAAGHAAGAGMAPEAAFWPDTASLDEAHARAADVSACAVRTRACFVAGVSTGNTLQYIGSLYATLYAAAAPCPCPTPGDSKPH